MSTTTPYTTDPACIATRPAKLVPGDIVMWHGQVLDFPYVSGNSVSVEFENGREWFPINYRIDRIEYDV